MSTSENDVIKLKAEIETLRKDFAAVTETVKQLSSERAHESLTRARRKVENTGNQIEAEIRERPFTSMVGTFSIGFILAKLLSR